MRISTFLPALFCILLILTTPVLAVECAFINITTGAQGVPGPTGPEGSMNQTINLTPGVDGAPGPDNDAWYIWGNGTRPFSANMSMGGFNISELLDPVALQDAVTLNYLLNTFPVVNSSYLTEAINNSYETVFNVSSMNETIFAYVNAFPIVNISYDTIANQSSITSLLATTANLSSTNETIQSQIGGFDSIVNVSQWNNAINDSIISNVSTWFALKTSVPDVSNYYTKPDIDANNTIFYANDTVHFANETSHQDQLQGQAVNDTSLLLTKDTITNVSQNDQAIIAQISGFDTITNVSQNLNLKDTIANVSQNDQSIIAQLAAKETIANTSSQLNLKDTIANVSQNLNLKDTIANVSSTKAPNPAYSYLTLMAGSSLVPTTNPATLDQTESGVGNNYIYGSFTDGGSENMQWIVDMPADWNGADATNGKLTFTFLWTAASGGGTVHFDIAGERFPNDAAINTALTAIGDATDTLITAEDMHVSPDTTAAVVASAGTNGQTIIFKVTRDSASDTLNAAAKLIGVRVKYIRTLA